MAVDHWLLGEWQDCADLPKVRPFVQAGRLCDVFRRRETRHASGMPRPRCNSDRLLSAIEGVLRQVGISERAMNTERRVFHRAEGFVVSEVHVWALQVRILGSEDE